MAQGSFEDQAILRALFMEKCRQGTASSSPNAANLHQKQTSKCTFNYHIGHALSVMIQKHSSSQGTEAEGKKAEDFRTTEKL